MRLYDQLDEINQAVFCYDIDSIVYADNGKNSVKTNDMLGEWTDELDNDIQN